MIDANTKQWFINRIAQNPEYLQDTFIPALEKLEEREQSALFQAIRSEGIEKIKYSMGRLDGVHESLALLSGLKFTSDSRKPDTPGLMARILGNWALESPSNPG